MCVLQDAVRWVGQIEGMTRMHQAIKKIAETSHGNEIWEAANQVADELAVSSMAAVTLRAVLVALHLGLATANQMWKWEILSCCVGGKPGLTANQIIDWEDEAGKHGVMAAPPDLGDFIETIQSKFHHAANLLIGFLSNYQNDAMTRTRHELTEAAANPAGQPMEELAVYEKNKNRTLH